MDKNRLLITQRAMVIARLISLLKNLETLDKERFGQRMFSASVASSTLRYFLSKLLLMQRLRYHSHVKFLYTWSESLQQHEQQEQQPRSNGAEANFPRASFRPCIVSNVTNADTTYILESKQLDSFLSNATFSFGLAI